MKSKVVQAQYTSLIDYLNQEIYAVSIRIEWLKDQWRHKPLSQGLSAKEMLEILERRPTQAQVDSYMKEQLHAEEILSFLRNQLQRL